VCFLHQEFYYEFMNSSSIRGRYYISDLHKVMAHISADIYNQEATDCFASTCAVGVKAGICIGYSMNCQPLLLLMTTPLDSMGQASCHLAPDTRHRFNLLQR
jgi:hypothetical protein